MSSEMELQMDVQKKNLKEMLPLILKLIKDAEVSSTPLIPFFLSAELTSDSSFPSTLSILGSSTTPTAEHSQAESKDHASRLWKSDIKSAR
ncbi:hypothetical protein ABW21_db0204419 [Orbilia brochopaga]|nr:hypothetical protein ABW21_db0204419 [Drechslerella brochopaga]